MDQETNKHIGDLPRILRNISDILENEQYLSSASSVCQAADTIEQLIGKLAKVEAVNADMMALAKYFDDLETKRCMAYGVPKGTCPSKVKINGIDCDFSARLTAALKP